MSWDKVVSPGVEAKRSPASPMGPFQKPQDLASRTFSVQETERTLVRCYHPYEEPCQMVQFGLYWRSILIVIVDWQVSALLKSNLATDALTMALFQGEVTKDLVNHLDRKVQYLSIAYLRAILEADSLTAVGSTFGHPMIMPY
ncbi:MAG: hypothetical protein M0T78_04145 [Actinomycetota bacterium]|nr:hypothetical protein [Actinomycetota bacterium]